LTALVVQRHRQQQGPVGLQPDVVGTFDQKTLATDFLKSTERGAHDVAQRSTVPALERQQIMRFR
jgi:hypothetical protein